MRLLLLTLSVFLRFTFTSAQVSKTDSLSHLGASRKAEEKVSNIGIAFTYSQNDLPDSLSPTMKNILKLQASDTVFYADSFCMLLFPFTIGEQFITKQSQKEISSYIIGKWKLFTVLRINDIPFETGWEETLIFKKNHKFYYKSSKATYSGKWEFDGSGKIEVTYNKPRLQIEDKKILEYLDEETKKRMEIHSEIYDIHEISSNKLSISTLKMTENNIFWRIIFMNYIKLSN